MEGGPLAMNQKERLRLVVRGGNKIPKKGGIKFPTTGGNMVSYDGETIIGGLKEDDHIGRVS
jgi:hypothetical protein